MDENCEWVYELLEHDNVRLFSSCRGLIGIVSIWALSSLMEKKTCDICGKKTVWRMKLGNSLDEWTEDEIKQLILFGMYLREHYGEVKSALVIPQDYEGDYYRVPNIDKVTDSSHAYYEDIDLLLNNKPPYEDILLKKFVIRYADRIQVIRAGYSADKKLLILQILFSQYPEVKYD